MPTLQTLVDPLGMLPRAARAGRWAGMAFGDAASGVALAALDRALASRRADEAVDLVVSRLLSGGLPERVADDLLARGVVERVADRVLSGPEIHRLVASVLETDDVWILVREIVQSPEVTDAIGHQGAGLAGQVADEVGERTRRADARLERLARRVLRRPPRVDPIGPFAPPSAP